MPLDATRSTVAAVVVTWNRRDLLIESLDGILAQHPAPKHVFVVDNASTDGTSDLVSSRFPDVRLLTCTENTGGAGGFALGLAAALETGVDAIWLMDDDTIPEEGALSALLSARDRYTAEPGGPSGPPVVVASRVEWTDGRPHPMNTPRIKPAVRASERSAAWEVGCEPVRTASFVSILVDAVRVREVGLPIADFFLWNDDFEYSARLIRDRRALSCNASVVRHHTKVFGSTDVDPGPRFYFEVRNKIWTFTRSPALAPAEKVLYGASTLRRWSMTLARSKDRATLVRGLVSGLRDGLQQPRRTRDILAGAFPHDLPVEIDLARGPGGGSR